MRQSLLRDQELTLFSQRSSIARSVRGPSLLTNDPSVGYHYRPQPSDRALKYLGDKSTLLVQKNVGIFRWLLVKYSRFPILNPERNAVLLWNILNFIIIAFYIFEIGFLIGWGDVYWQDELTYFYYGNIFFIIFFLADIVISPLKAYFQNGILVENRINILKRYLRLYLWFDLLAFLGVTIPYVSRNVASNYFKVLFLFKLVSAYDLDKYLSMLVRHRFGRSIAYAMSRIVFFMILWSHWLGVIFFAIDYALLQSNYYGPNTPNVIWIYNSALSPGHNLQQQPWTIQYLYSLYYSIGNITTIAYGDITARNPISCLYTVFNMSISALLFTYFFKQMIEVIFLAQGDEIQNSNNITLIRRYLQHNKVTNFLQTKIRSYFQTNWEEQRFRNRDIELDFISKLPKELKQKLNISLFGDFILELGLPANLDHLSHIDNKTTFIFELADSFQFERITAGQVLYSQGQKFEAHQFVYFCDKSYGELAITLGQGVISEEALRINTVEKLTVQVLNMIHLKSMKIAHLCGLFGQASFFNKNRRDHWAISNKNVELLKLSRNKLDQLVDTFASPLEKERLFITSQEIAYRKCYLCSEQGHRFSQCPFMTYVPDFNTMLNKIKDTNQRINNENIRKMREAERIRTARNNCWKMYVKQNEILQENSSHDSWSREESLGDQRMSEDFLFQLVKLKTKVTQRVEQPKIDPDSLDTHFDVDRGYLFKLYKIQDNMDNTIVRCSEYLKAKKLERKFMKKQ